MIRSESANSREIRRRADSNRCSALERPYQYVIQSGWSPFGLAARPGLLPPKADSSIRQRAGTQPRCLSSERARSRKAERAQGYGAGTYLTPESQPAGRGSSRSEVSPVSRAPWNPTGAV